MILKTTTKCLAKLEKLIIADHPYDTPEFIILRFAGRKPALFGLAE